MPVFRQPDNCFFLWPVLTTNSEQLINVIRIHSRKFVAKVRFSSEFRSLPLSEAKGGLCGKSAFAFPLRP
jgi:hypothetical protein